MHPSRNAAPDVSLPRCPWATSELLVDYHDREWGVPAHGDRLLFEFLVLEGAQAGLSWETVLRKRENYRRAFDGFDPANVAGYGEAEVARLLSNPGIIRNRAKIRGAIGNARLFLMVQAEHGSFDAYFWGFVRHLPINLPCTRWERVTRTDLSDQLSKDLTRRGFKFVGTTICYALMQAVGMVNDHDPTCFRRSEVAALR